MELTERRICPRFDGVCLQGGCGYCNDAEFQTIDSIEIQASDKGLYREFLYGRTHRFNNAETR